MIAMLTSIGAYISPLSVLLLLSVLTQASAAFAADQMMQGRHIPCTALTCLHLALPSTSLETKMSICGPLSMSGPSL